MKTRLLLTVFVIAVLLTSCYETINRTSKRTIQVPIYEYTTEKEAEDGLIQGAPTSLSSFGNIYIYQNYLLINERGKGIHIYDNSNPSSPTQVSFMNIPGNYDMAIQNDVLYVDSYDDLLSLDLTNINAISLKERFDNVFPQSHPSRGIIVGYKDSIIEYNEKISSSFGNNDDDQILLSSGNFTTSNEAGGGGGSATGTGGSFARFTIANNHLFAIDSRVLNVFDITSRNQIVKQSSTPINQVNEIETVFPYQNSLFIGSTNGLVIYDITDPKNISFESVFAHARACDPVYVEDDVAFVTLRSLNNNRCAGFSNQLDVIDVDNVSSPRFIKSIQMINPHGVGADDSLLFICEGASGLKTFDVQKVYSNNVLSDVSISQIKWDQSIFAYDVIPNNGNLIVVGEKELSQYDYTDPQNIKFISKIE